MMENQTVNSFELMNEGLNCLIEQLGVLKAERFISIVIKEKFDYTKWRRSIFDGMSGEEFNDAAVAYAKAHPFKSKHEQVSI